MACLGVLPPAKVVSAVVLPHCVAAGGGVGAGRGQGAGGSGQSPDAVKFQVTHSHRPEVEGKHATPREKRVENRR